MKVLEIKLKFYKVLENILEIRAFF